MRDHDTRVKGEVTWPTAAGYWVLGWLVTSAILLVLAIVIGVFHAPAPAAPTTPLMNDVHAMHSMLDDIAFAFSAVVIGVAILSALPIQATALQLRCNQQGSAIFAAVAGLSFLSAIVSFLVCRASDPIVSLTDPSAEQLTIGLVGCYAIHVVVLLIARGLAWRARRVRSPSVAF